MADEAGVAESGFVGDFASEPRRNGELTVGRIELDFRDNQSLIFPGEFVDLPGEIAERNIPAALDDDGLGTKTGKESNGVRDRDGILELGAGNAGNRALDREACLVARDAGTDRHAVTGGEIPLLKLFE